MRGEHPVLQAIVDSAMEFTSARAGWLVTNLDAGGLQVVAVAGGDSSLIGSVVASGSGALSYVMESGQPLALASGRAQPNLNSALLVDGRQPTNLLCVPCESGGRVVGALELVDKAGASGFSFDDVELATLLASIAGVTLLTEPLVRLPPVTPAEALEALESLAADRPRVYGALTALVSGLQDHG